MLSEDAGKGLQQSEAAEEGIQRSEGLLGV